jgi:hypothetical protein
MKLFSLFIASLLVASPVAAQPYPPPYYYAPPVVIAAPPPDPIASFFGAIFGIPFGPAPMVPDGAGGFVPFTNSRVMPDGSLRPYDPAIDGPFYGPLPQSYEPSPQAQPYYREPPHPAKCSQYAYSTCLHDAGPYCRKEAASAPAATRAVDDTACLARYQSTCREVHCD